MSRTEYALLFIIIVSIFGISLLVLPPSLACAATGNIFSMVVVIVLILVLIASFIMLLRIIDKRP